MKTSKLRNLILVVAGAVTLVGGQVGMFAAAATTSKTTPKTSAQSVNNATNTLKISPVRSDISIAPGTTGTVTVTVYNTTGTAVALKPIENDFIAGDENGTPSIILDENSYAPTHSLKRFMVPLKNITVAANDSKDVAVSVVVPKSAQAGGYFGAIRFAPVTASGDTSVNVGASVASLILMTVPGPTTEKLTMTNFDIQQNGGNASNFRTPTGISLFLRFKNDGNVQEAPFGVVYVKKGNKTVFTTQFNDNNPKQTILPDSARRWTVPLKGFGKFGKYTIGGTFGWGSKGETIEVTKTVWIVPSTYIFGGLILLAVIVGLIVFFVLFLRSYKKRVLRKSRRRY